MGSDQRERRAKPLQSAPGPAGLGDSDAFTGGTFVGIHGSNLANHYFPSAPDAAFQYRVSGEGWRLPFFFLWRTLPDPPEMPEEIQPWERVQDRVLPLVFAQPADKAYRIDNAGYGIDMTAAMSAGIMQRAADSSVQWLSPVEPSALAGAGRSAPVAVMAAADGARVGRVGQK